MAGKVVCLLYLVTLIVGCLGGSVLKVNLSGVVKKTNSDFKFWIESDAWRVSFCFRYLYISYILWDYIQDILVSLCLPLLFIKIDKLLTLCTMFFLDFMLILTFIDMLDDLAEIIEE